MFRLLLSTDLRAINEKPFETVQEWIGVFDQRPEATVLMRSLRAALHALIQALNLPARGWFIYHNNRTKTLETRLNGIHVRTH